MQHLPQPIIAGEANVDERLIEAGDRTTVHLLVWPVAAVYPHNGGLVTKGRRVARRTAERLGPIRGQPLSVIGVKTVAERVADHVVVHHPGMPRARQAKQTVNTTGRLEYGMHVQKIPRSPSRRKRVGLARPRVSVLP